MNVDYSAYEGRRVRGVVRSVLARGELIVENGTFVGRPGRGRYQRRKTRFED
jgi:dihydropyrimidinase